MSTKSKKSVVDDKKGKVFEKILRSITVAIHKGGSDPTCNWTLKLALKAAKDADIPKIKVDETIKKATLPTNTADFKETMYEGYVGSIAVIVEALTRKVHDTVQHIKSTFKKHGGALGEPGSVCHTFDNLGFITYPQSVGDEDAMLELALEAGAEDCQLVGDKYEIFSKYDQLHKVKDCMESKLGEAINAKLIWKPKHLLKLDQYKTLNMVKFINILEDLDDVQYVWTNLEYPEDLKIN